MVAFALVLLSAISVLSGVGASDTCQPVTWTNSKRRDEGSPARSGRRSTGAMAILDSISDGNVTTGEVNCRYSATTGSNVNYYTCTQLATKYGVTTDLFFTLNPTLKPDCSNIQPNTQYCVDGFIEPLRSSNGLCGPPNNNATCLGTAYQCCNSQTWTCGNSTDDCAAGTCYEGACAGDSVYSTDGTCGTAHGNRLCAGRWGDCCNLNGICGTGDAFCGTSVCQLGNCTLPATGPGLGWTDGNSTDGTCGGTNKFTCNVVYGYCCNKNNTCGSSASDCGEGCQPLFGKCGAVSTSSTSSSSTKSSSSTSSSSVHVTTTGTTSTTKISTTSGSTKTTASSTSTKPTSTSTSHTTTKPTSTSTTTNACTTSISSALSALPSCGQLCFSNMVAQYSTLGCAHPTDSACLCANANFGYGLRDCSSGACGADAAAASSAVAYGSAFCSCAGTVSATVSVSATATTGFAALPSCGQLCFDNMLAQYASLGCASEQDAACLCGNVNFGYGLRDCSNGACGTAVASTVIAYGSAYCGSATATATAGGKR